MNWNHRVIRDGDLLRLVEVSYDETGKPIGYNEAFMLADDMAGLQVLVSRLANALTQPIIDASELENLEEPEAGIEEFASEEALQKMGYYDAAPTPKEIVSKLITDLGCDVEDDDTDTCPICGRDEPCDDCQN